MMIQIPRQKQYIMSFAFVFDREDDRYEFSYCYPYTISDLDEHLSAIESRR